MPATQTKNFYFLKDFHGGRDGRVWLAMNESGKLCVIKLSPVRKYEDEVRNWRMIWGETSVRTMTLMNAQAMIMPVVFHGCRDKDKIFFRPIGSKCTEGDVTVNDIRNSEISCNFDGTLERYFEDPHQVAVEAITSMADKGYKHDDLDWRHVGLLPYPKTATEWAVRPVLIDLHQVTYFKENVSIGDLCTETRNVIKSSLRILGIEEK